MKNSVLLVTSTVGKAQIANELTNCLKLRGGGPKPTLSQSMLQQWENHWTPMLQELADSEMTVLTTEQREKLEAVMERAVSKEKGPLMLS